jgi:hypothetical protein
MQPSEKNIHKLIQQDKTKTTIQQQQQQQQNGFSPLCVDVSPDKITRTKERWLYNRTIITLSDDAKGILTKELLFAPTPRDPPATRFIVGAEQAAMLVGSDSEAATHIRSQTIKDINSYRMLNPNMTKGEQQAIKELKADPGVTIFPADKGRATVLMPTTQYENEMAAIVSDTTTYRQLPGDPTQKHKKPLGSFILHKVKNKGYITDKVYHGIRPTSDIPPRIQAQPKVHKKGDLFRPIVAGQGSITEGLSKELTCIIQPTLGRTPYHIRDSEDLKGKLKDMIIPPTHKMVSFVVTNMYTEIPRDEAIETICNYLLDDPTLKERTKIPVDTIIKLLQMSLSMAYFVWRGTFYEQTNGLPQAGLAKTTRLFK